jgi:hypothetical protein
VNHPDHVRLRTWAIEITQTLLGDTGVIQGNDLRFKGRGGFVVHRRTGAWYCHAEARGGYSTVALIAFLRDCTSLDADQWGVAWLQAHPGDGSCAGNVDDTDASAAHTAANDMTAHAVLDAAVPLTGARAAPAVAYLSSRGLQVPYPVTLRYLPDDIWLEQVHRPGEGALVAELHAHGALLGVQITWLNPLGAKSLHVPVRETFRFVDPRAKASVFSLAVSKDQVWNAEHAPARVLVECVEDALSCYVAGLAPRIDATLGTGGMHHVEVHAGEQLVVFRDGDAAGSPADKGLIAGIDRLLIEGATVRVTATPPEEDANSLLQGRGVEGVRETLAGATQATLSINGEITRLARLEQLDYDQQRTKIARKFNIRVGTLDDEVKQARPSRPAAEGNGSIPADEPWEGDVELGDVLDKALVQTRRYIVAEDTLLATIVIWCAHTHTVHNDEVRLQRTPRLAIQSRVKGSGKTTTLEIVRELSARGLLRGSYTASSIFRTIDLLKPTYCLDEADRILRDDKSDLVAVLNNGDRRASAMVERSVPAPDGGWQVEIFNTWGAVAFAGIDELPETLQDRSVSARLRKVLANAVPEHLRDGTSIELVELRRQLAAWGSALTELPDPELPEILLHRAGRVGDCWRPLIAIADLAGGQWPALIRKAAENAAVTPGRPSELERLLASIRRAFEAQAEKDAARRAAGDKSDDKDWPDNQHRLRTPTLLTALLGEQDEDWNTAHRGRPVTAYYLKDQLRHLLEPPGAQDWWTGSKDQRTHHSGYHRLQFTKVWETHLAGDVPSPSPSPVASGASGAPPETKGKSPAKQPFSGSAGTPEGAPDEGAFPASGAPTRPSGAPPKSGNSLNSLQEDPSASVGAPGAPDAPDLRRGLREEGVGGPDGADGASDATTPGSGSATPPVRSKRPPNPTTVLARELAAEHPTWKPSRIARTLGVAEAKVVTALRGWARPQAPAPAEEAPT